jgi:hypothetical protein
MTEAAVIGKRQDILDSIFNVEAEKTPVLSMLKTGSRPEGMSYSWVAEVNPAVVSTGVLDGTPATTPARVDRVLLESYCQHFRTEWGVTYLASLTNSAGAGRNEVGHQRAKAMMLLKRAIEQRILSSSDNAAETGGTPFQTRGMFSWLSNAAQSVKPVDSTLRPASACNYASTIAGLTESAFRDILDAMYDARKEVADVFGIVGRDLKAHMDDWTNIYPIASTTSQPRTVYQVRGNEEYLNKVDVLRFSTGTVRLMVSPFLYFDVTTGLAQTESPKSGLLVDLDMWKWRWLDKPANTNLAADGSGTKGFVDAVGTLCCLNPLGQARLIIAS